VARLPKRTEPAEGGQSANLVIVPEQKVGLKLIRFSDAMPQNAYGAAPNQKALFNTPVD